MAIQSRFATGQRQASEVALILALLAGISALVVVLGGFLAVDLRNRAEPYLSGRSAPEKPADPTTAPKLDTQINGELSNIVEVDDNGQVLRVIHSSEIKARVASFTLFAVPQASYAGKAYLQSTADANIGTLIVYPLDVVTGQLSAAVINVPSSKATVSPDQTRVAVINLTPTRMITAFEIATGATLASWTLANNERIAATDATWISNNCFEHEILIGSGAEIRTFCLAATNE